MSEKSFIQSLVDFLFLRQRNTTQKKRNISPQEAIALQKEYMTDFCNSGQPFEMPYVEIAKQLFAPEDSVFEAAIYYLIQIALNQKEAAEPIEVILNSYVHKCKNVERQNKILSAIEMINGIKQKAI
jgi:RNase P subunit RPR2